MIFKFRFVGLSPECKMQNSKCKIIAYLEMNV